MKYSLSALSLLLAASTVLADPKIEVYFSPKGGCTDAVVDALSNVKSNVLVQAYSFTSPAIAKSLTEAHRRGVKVEVVLDKSNRTGKYSAATFTHNYRLGPAPAEARDNRFISRSRVCWSGSAAVESLFARSSSSININC